MVYEHFKMPMFWQGRLRPPARSRPRGQREKQERDALHTRGITNSQIQRQIYTCKSRKMLANWRLEAIAFSFHVQNQGKTIPVRASAP